jgi:hypothetical protein
MAPVDRQGLGIAPDLQPVVARQDTTVTALACMKNTARLCAPAAATSSSVVNRGLTGQPRRLRSSKRAQGSCVLLCGREPGSSNPLRQNAATHDPRSVIEFVSVCEGSGKLGEATGTRVGAHVMW